MTRYAELWRKEQADKERLQTQLERQLKILIDEKRMLASGSSRRMGHEAPSTSSG